jgi:hypothetical protein
MNFQIATSDKSKLQNRPPKDRAEALGFPPLEIPSALAPFATPRTVQAPLKSRRRNPNRCFRKSARHETQFERIVFRMIQDTISKESDATCIAPTKSIYLKILSFIVPLFSRRPKLPVFEDLAKAGRDLPSRLRTSVVQASDSRIST